MIGVLKYLTVEKLADYQDHLIMSTTDFAEACAKANSRGYQNGREKAIDEFVSNLKEACFPLSNIRYDVGGEVVDMDDVFEIAKQLKENKG